MRIKIEILTPVHIGSGEEISPLEYFIDREKGVVHRLNLNTLFQDERFNDHRERFINEAAKRRYIGQIISDQNLLRRHILYSVPISADARRAIMDNPANIKAYIKSAGRPYIPGSALKGSLLSALIWHIIKEKYAGLCNSQKEKINKIFLDREDRDMHWASDDLLNLAFFLIEPESGFSKPKYEKGLSEHKNESELPRPKFAQWLSVSDSNFHSCQESLQISLVKVKGSKSKGELSIFYETLKEGQVFEAEIERQDKRKDKTQEYKLSEINILKIAHNFYSKVAQKDGQNLIKYSDKLPSENYLVRLGQGSTAYSTSLLLLAEDLGIGYFVGHPQTRKRIADSIPMGFAQISCL